MSKQHAIGSKFDASSTADEVIRGVDLTGKTAIVTGGYVGLGLETARVLKRAGARVIVPARNLEKARKSVPEGIEIAELDLVDPKSVATFAQRFLDSGAPLHILVDNAGVMAMPRVERDGRGYEMHFSTNHLGHFQLTTLLWPALRRANGARVVSLTSWGHRFSRVIFDDPNFERRAYDPWSGYGQSKTANILFAVGVDARGKADGIRAFAVHPGNIPTTELPRHFPANLLQEMGVLDADGNPIFAPEKQLKTTNQGVATSIWCATSQELDGLGGVYCENTEVAKVVPPEEIKAEWEMSDAQKLVGVMPYAIEEDAAARLWTLSEKLVSH